MPSSDDILAGLTAVANEWRTLAIVWHVAFAIWLLAFLRGGWRPSNHVAGYVLAAPILSVSVAAWASRNPFNGAVFLALFLYLAATAARMDRTIVRVASPEFSVPGVVLAAFGWSYPHFLETERWFTYVYAAPFGLLPCPTLAMVIGVTLTLGSLGSRSWTGTLAASSLVFGAIGVFHLGVMLDAVLIAGSLVSLAALTTFPRLPLIERHRNGAGDAVAGHLLDPPRGSP